MESSFNLYDEQIMSSQIQERLTREARIQRNKESDPKDNVITATGRFLIRTGNRLLAIA